jgi:exocyst complex component 2
MALEIVRLYISLISEFFSLSDKAVVAPSRDSIHLPSFIPQGSNSITTAFFVSRILADISECVGDVATAELAGDAASGLKSLLESARWRFEIATCDLWLQGALSYCAGQSLDRAFD